jgi:hypothetical protein
MTLQKGGPMGLQTGSLLEAERSAWQVAQRNLALALTQIAEHEKRLLGRTTERVVPVGARRRSRPIRSRG